MTQSATPLDNTPDTLATDVELNAESPSLDPTLALQAELEKIQADLAEAKQAVLYAKAEAENIRRRGVEETDKARKFAVEKFASELLAVKDSLEMALAVENASAENLKNGVELTLRQLNSAFEKFQLQEINPVGEKLDPHRHQAMAMVDADAEANTVVMVMQKGYLLAERILRHGPRNRGQKQIKTRKHPLEKVISCPT